MRARARGRAGGAWSEGELTRYSPERIGLLSMLLPGRRVRRPLAGRLDLVRAGRRAAWRWSAPAGWRVAGRCGPPPGPLPTGCRRRASARRGGLLAAGRPGSVRIAVASAAVLAALLAAWSQWQPQRSEDAREAALGAAGEQIPPARGRRRSARCRATRCRSKRCSRSRTSSGVGGQPRVARGDAAAGGAPAAVQPADLADAGPLRPGRATRGPRCRSCGPRSTSNPESISAEAIAAGPAAKRSKTYNDYVQALRASAQLEARLRTASAPRCASSRRRAPGSPPAPRTSTCSKPKSSSSAASVAAAVEAQVVGARIEVRRERPPRQRQLRAAAGGRATGVLSSSRPPERSTRRSLREPGGRVGDVLDHLARPHDVEARVLPAAQPPSPSIRRRSSSGWRARARRSGSSATSTPTTCAPARASCDG